MNQLLTLPLLLLVWNSSGKSNQCWKKAKPFILNISRAKSNALKSLKCNVDIRILVAHKVNCTVVINKSISMEKLNTLLDSGAYKCLEKDSTPKIDRKILKLLSKHKFGAFC
jgi:hypothetical protein